MMKKTKKDDHQSIYALTAYEYDLNDNDEIALLPDGVSLKLHSEACGVFSSVKKAENALKKIVHERNDGIKNRWNQFEYFGFVLVEHYLDDPFCKGNSGFYISHFRSIRTYLPDGTLNYFSDCDDACEKPFKGTSMHSRFKAGDFAWILNDYEEYATPTLIEEEAYSKKQWKSKFAKDVVGDCFDDAGIDFPLNAGGHNHTFAPMMFPEDCIMKIPSKAKAKMHATRKTWAKTGI